MNEKTLYVHITHAVLGSGYCVPIEKLGEEIQQIAEGFPKSEVITDEKFILTFSWYTLEEYKNLPEFMGW
jgi:hypothetical protein